MKNAAALLALLIGAAGMLAAPALAADGETGTGTKDAAKPVCEGQKKECGDAAKCGEAGKCSDASEKCEKEGAGCAKCVEGAAGGKECCVAKKAAADLQVVTLSVLKSSGEGWKAVAAAIPEKELARVEKERADAWKGLVKIRRAIESAKAECKAVCDEAKAAGKEASCEVTSAYEGDVKGLEKKAREVLDGLAATVKEVVGADNVAALAETVRKDGDVAAAVMASVREEAAKPEAEAQEEGKDAGTEPGQAKPGCGTGAAGGS